VAGHLKEKGKKKDEEEEKSFVTAEVCSCISSSSFLLVFNSDNAELCV
jgi:hypothetical protein